MIVWFTRIRRMSKDINRSWKGPIGKPLFHIAKKYRRVVACTCVSRNETSDPTLVLGIALYSTVHWTAAEYDRCSLVNPL